MLSKFTAFILLNFLLCQAVLCQKDAVMSISKECDNWYFGAYAGITFNTPDRKPKTLTDGALSTWEGCSSVSDRRGNLLIYSDGRSVWNRFHRVMPNGTELAGHISSTQSALIVPKPGDSSIYYIFTADQGGYFPSPAFGINYSVIDLKLDSGRGDITKKNIPLLSPATEKLTAVKHANNSDIWIIAHEWESNEFHSFLVTDSTVHRQPVISRTGSVHDDPSDNTIGYMRASPDGTKIALVIYMQKTIEIFDFNSSTGILSNPLSIKNDKYSFLHGVEFSANSTKLYISGFDNMSRIYQFNLEAGSPEAVKNSEIIVATDNDLSSIGALKLGPDGKIYVARYLRNYLGVINAPDEKGASCNFADQQVSLGNKTCFLGLPDYLSDYYIECGKFSFDYPNFRNLDGIRLAGDAAVEDKIIRLTPSKNFKRGAIWYDTAVNFQKGFSLNFRFRFSEASDDGFNEGSLPGADGIAVVFKKPGTPDFGLSGGGLGYQDIPNSLAIEFDTYKNTETDKIIDPNGNHIAVQSSGKEPNTPNHISLAKLAVNDTCLLIKSDSTVYNVLVEYNLVPKKLRVYLSSLNHFLKPDIELDSLDLLKLLGLDSPEIEIGITAATGNARQAQDILNWSLCSKPEPAINFYPEEQIGKDFSLFSISPNPAANYIDLHINNNIELSDKSYTYEIFSVEGIETISGVANTFSNLSTRIDVSGLEPGMYFLKVRLPSGNTVEKFVKIH